VLVFLAGSGVLLAQDDPQDWARETVQKAIKATGVEGKGIPKGIRLRAKYSIDAFDKDAEFHEVRVFQTTTMRFPFQLKDEKEATVLGESATFTTIYDGKNGWLKNKGKVDEMEPAQLEEFKEMANVVEATYFLTPLLDKQKYKLKETGMALVDGRRAFEIRVSRQGFKNMKLYFDFKTNLLVKMERKGRDPQTGVECTETHLYRSYQKMNGRMVPGAIAMLRNGELAYEMQILDFAELNEIDASEFARPK
jgi:hypothetical protein